MRYKDKVLVTEFLAFSPTHPQPAPEVSQGNCGDGWEERPGTDTCYSFIDKTNDLYSRAYKLCERKGGHLVSINSLDEEVYLSGKVLPYHKIPSLARKLKQTCIL